MGSSDARIVAEGGCVSSYPTAEFSVGGFANDRVRLGEILAVLSFSGLS